MFLPLVEYHGGGAAATFEPLEKNLKAYEWALAQYFGAGVMACYRGFRQGLFKCLPEVDSYYKSSLISLQK